MKKKVVLLAASLLVFAACGSDSGSPAGEVVSSVAPAETATSGGEMGDAGMIDLEALKSAATTVVQSTLEALLRNGEAVAASDPSISDEALAAVVVDESTGAESTTVTRDGTSGVRASSSGPGFSCMGTVTFTAGRGALSPVTCS